MDVRKAMILLSVAQNLPAAKWHERVQRSLLLFLATEPLRVELLRLVPEALVVVHVLRGINQRGALGYDVLAEFHVLLCLATIDVRDGEQTHALFDGHFQIRNVVQIVDRRYFFVSDGCANVFAELESSLSRSYT